MSGGRGGRGGSDAEGGGAASLETAPGQVDTTPMTSVIAAVLNEVYELRQTVKSEGCLFFPFTHTHSLSSWQLMC